MLKQCLRSLVAFAVAAMLPFNVSAQTSRPDQDFAVGSGQFPKPELGCQENFSVSAHVRHDEAVVVGIAQSTATGTVNQSLPSTCAQTGNFTAKVDCVQVTGPSGTGEADITAKVTTVEGLFFTSFLTVGQEISYLVKDNDPNADTTSGVNPTDKPCHFVGDVTMHTQDHGDISVHEDDWPEP
jgi:hypothetical protein